MTFEGAVLTALEWGEGNPREITERMQSRVRRALNRLADDGHIKRYGADGQGIEKIFSLSGRPHPSHPLWARRL